MPVEIDARTRTISLWRRLERGDTSNKNPPFREEMRMMPDPGAPVVMVVEDDEEMNALERDLLAVHGMRSIPAYDGREALELCQEHDAALVLLDLMLPGMDGLETCRRLRRSDGTRPYIVILSALDSAEYRDHGYELGADAYFAKPFDPDALIDTLRALMAQPRPPREG